MSVKLVFAVVIEAAGFSKGSIPAQVCVPGCFDWQVFLRCCSKQDKRRMLVRTAVCLTARLSHMVSMQKAMTSSPCPAPSPDE